MWHWEAKQAVVWEVQQCGFVCSKREGLGRGSILPHFYKKRCQISAYSRLLALYRQRYRLAWNAMMAGAGRAAATAVLLLNSNKSLLLEELQAIEDEDSDMPMFINGTNRKSSSVIQHTRIASYVELACNQHGIPRCYWQTSISWTSSAADWWPVPVSCISNSWTERQCTVVSCSSTSAIWGQ